MQTTIVSIHDTEFKGGASKVEFELFLQSGGDERIWRDPITGRNRYGTSLAPAGREIWFSSSTATTISERGYVAARRAFEDWMNSNGSRAGNLSDWFEALRERLTSALGIQGAQVVFSASGTDAEIVALTVARHLLRGSLTNIVIAPEETGSGVMTAAEGRHFNETSAFHSGFRKGDRLAGWEGDTIKSVGVGLRDGQGGPRPGGNVDDEVLSRARAALRAGDKVMLHVLDVSKTGQGGPSRDAAAELLRNHPDRVAVVVDACQLRCPFESIRTDLEAGFLVLITGSKFAAGPPFCGALLIPPQLMGALETFYPPRGLANYSARFDWPGGLHASLPTELFTPANIGLALRWEAALAEIESYSILPQARRLSVIHAFGAMLKQRLAVRPRLDLLDEPRADARASTIFPVFTDDGAPARAFDIYHALRTADGASPPCHVGQPVAIGDRSALRICLSMPLVTEVARKLERGLTTSASLGSLSCDLDVMFDKWDRVAGPARVTS